MTVSLGTWIGSVKAIAARRGGHPFVSEDGFFFSNPQSNPQSAMSCTSKNDVGYRNIDYTPVSLIYGEGNISSTFEDMYRWDQALNGDKLVKQSTLAQALTPGKPANEILTDYGFWLADSPLARDTVLRAWESLARIQNFHSKVSAPSPDRCNSLQSRASRYKCLAGKNC